MSRLNRYIFKNTALTGYPYDNHHAKEQADSIKIDIINGFLLG